MRIYNFAEYHFTETGRDVDKQEETDRDTTKERERRNEFIMTDGPGCLPTSKAPAIRQRLHRRAIQKKKKCPCPCGIAQVRLLKDKPR